MIDNSIFFIFDTIITFLKTWSLVIFIAAVFIAFIVSIFMYVKAKRKNKKAPDTYTVEQIESRKTFLIAMSIIFGLIVLVIGGFAALMMMAVAYM